MSRFIEIIDAENNKCMLNVNNIIAITDYDGGYARLKCAVGGTLDTAVPYKDVKEQLRRL